MSDKGKIKVSVLCLTYNHENYIRKTLEGFVMQKTDFAFEVLVHDDASTDGTANIIREFEAKYPEIIKPIYQTENLYSQGKPIIKAHITPRAQGEYFAICEGDDYWIDPYKLQKQVNFLDKNPGYTVCANKTVFHNISENKDSFFPDIEADRDFTLRDIILYGGGLFATCSLMVKKEIFLTMPDCFKAKGFSDYQLYLYGAICGKVYCLNDIMSYYNSGVVGSWTKSEMSSNQKRIKHISEFVSLLERIDKYYGFKYHEYIKIKLYDFKYIIYDLTENKSSYGIIERIGFTFYGLKENTKSFLRKNCKFLVGLKRKIMRRGWI